MDSARRLPVIAAGPSLPLARKATAPLERCGAGDRFFDYVLEEYAPLGPFDGKLRSVNVLVEAFALAGVEREGRDVIGLVRGALGDFRTVWGIKHDAAFPGLRSFELYFYDPSRNRADLSIARICEALAPRVRIAAREVRPLPWHMFSIELDVEALRAGVGGSVHVYLDMRSYELSPSGPLFENIYTFHDPKKDIDEILERVSASIHVDAIGENIATLMPPSLFRCHRVCVANKRRSDALYFARVPVAATLEFMNVRRWPSELTGFLAAHAGDMQHLTFDVGVDFHAGPDGAALGKMGLYGSF